MCISKRWKLNEPLAEAEMAEDGGEPATVRAGDSFVIRPGFRGTWEVIETTRKDYVIRV